MLKDSGLEECHFTHVAIALGLHLIPRPDEVVRDVVRILKPGGVFGCITPHAEHIGWVADLKTAFASFPFEVPFEEKNRSQTHDVGRWYDEAWVGEYLGEMGFGCVNVHVERGVVSVKGARHWIDVFGPVISWLMNNEWDEELRSGHSLEEVKGLVEKHLEEKYAGKGWDTGFACIIASGTLEK